MESSDSALNSEESYSNLLKHLSPNRVAEMADEISALDPNIYKTIARACKSREVFVKKLPPAAKGRRVQRALGDPQHPGYAEQFLRDYLLRCRINLVERFLNGLSIEHMNGSISDSCDEPASEPLRQAVQDLVNNFPTPDVALYLNALLISQGPEKWSNLSDLIKKDSRLQLAEIDHLGDKEITEALEVPKADVRYIATGTTVLDNVLIKAIVEAKNKVMGSFSSDDISSVVDEFIHLNAARHQSFFHLGYGESLGLEMPEVDRKGWEPNRFGWYFQGRFAGLLRQREFEQMIKIYREHFDRIAPLLKAENHGRELSAYLFEALSERGNWREAAEIIAPHILQLPADTREALVREILQTASKGVASGEIAEAKAMLESCEIGLESLDRSEYKVWARYCEFERRRRLAQCFMHERDWKAALHWLEKSQELAESEKEKASVISDIGLVHAQFRHLGDVEIPAPPEDRKEFQTRLDKGKSLFLKAFEEDPKEIPKGPFALGLIAWLDKDFEKSSNYFSYAYSAMKLRWDDHERFPSWRRCMFYHAASLLLALASTDPSNSIELIDQSMKLGFKPHPDELGELLNWVADLQPQVAANLVDVLVSNGTEIPILEVKSMKAIAPYSHKLRENLELRIKEPTNTARKAIELLKIKLSIVASLEPSEALDVLDTIQCIA